MDTEKMNNKHIFTKILAVTGAFLVWFPLAAPFLLGLASLLADGRFRFDYLMPAELALPALAGCGLLLWAALRLRSQVRLIAWGLGLAVGFLVGAQALAEVTGLASGHTEMGGWQFVLVLAMLALYVLALAVVGIAGVRLLRGLFRAGSDSGGGMRS